MNYHIDIDAIASSAILSYRNDEEKDIREAPMTDIADYAAAAVHDFMEDFIEEMTQTLSDLVEQEIQGW